MGKTATTLIERTVVSPSASLKRLPLEITQAMHDALMGAKAEDGITVADRLRALIDLWQEDHELAERTRARVRSRALAVETERRRKGG